MDYIVRQESPDIFHLWTGITAISTATRRNIFLDRGTYKLFPNFYVVLVSDSGISRKSGAMDIGINLLEQLKGVSIIHGKATSEGLMDAMDRIRTLPDNRIVPDGSLFIHADELSELFGKASYVADLSSFLTTVYSSKTKDFLTRHKALTRVKNPYLCLLAGTTPEHLSEIISLSTMKLGLTGRILFIYGRGISEKVSKPELDRKLESGLLDDLQSICDTYGEMKMTQNAEKAFDAWYNSYNPPVDVELSPFCARKHDHILKTAMIMSLAESNDLVIRKGHFDAAKVSVDQIEENLPQVFSSIGATQESKLGELILRILRRNDPEMMSHSVLLRRVYKHVQTGEMFRKIMDTLIESKRVLSEVSSKGEFYRVNWEEMKNEKSTKEV